MQKLVIVTNAIETQECTQCRLSCILIVNCEQHSYCSIFLLLNQKLFFQIRLFSEHSVSEPLLFLMKIYNIIYSLIEPQKTMLFLSTQEI